ncbi:hypothetical protein DRH27_04230 [Candidatus Falkowbacteria bacterium]|nr:MAG: hypothetical protein DRH27_04230 [Candidatus Falkowbacteria bacterium]
MSSSRKKDEELISFGSLHKKGRITKSTEDYYFDRYIFRSYFAVVLCVVILALSVLGLRGGAYAYCPDDAVGGRCDNPLYEYKSYLGLKNCTYDACQVETLQAGESIGEKPPEALEIIIFTVVTFGFVAITINHLRQKENKRLYRGKHNIKSKNK